MAIDPNIPLDTQPIRPSYQWQNPDLIGETSKALTVEQQALWLQREKQDMQAQEELRQAFGGVDFTTPQGRNALLVNVGKKSPQVMLQLMQSFNQLDSQAAMVKERLAAANAKDVETFGKLQDEIHAAALPSMIVYNNALSKGATEEQARQQAQIEYDNGKVMLRNSGMVSDQWLASLPPAFDPSKVGASLYGTSAFKNYAEGALKMKTLSDKPTANIGGVPISKGPEGWTIPDPGGSGKDVPLSADMLKKYKEAEGVSQSKPTPVTVTKSDGSTETRWMEFDKSGNPMDVTDRMTAAVGSGAVQPHTKPVEDTQSKPTPVTVTKSDGSTETRWVEFDKSGKPTDVTDRMVGAMGGGSSSQPTAQATSAAKPDVSKFIQERRTGADGKEQVKIGGAWYHAPSSAPAAPAAPSKITSITPRSAAGESGVPGYNAQAAQSDMHGDPYLSTLPKSTGAQVKALSEGRQQFPSGFALRSPYWQQMLQMVSQYDPSFDAVNYNARSKTRNDFSAGKYSQQINAMNTVVGHLGTLKKAADSLNNTNWPVFNKLENYIRTNTGDPRVVKFNTARKAVVDELTRVYRGVGGSEQDIKTWSDQINASNSPAQLHAALAQMGSLLESKLSALQATYDQGMGSAAKGIQLITPKARKALDALKEGNVE